MIYAVPEKIQAALTDHVNEFKIIHQACPLIENAYRSVRNSGDVSRIFTVIYPDFIDVAVFVKGKFELYNSFQWKCSEELKFYFLYIFCQFFI